jgi:hypothetical protein
VPGDTVRFEAFGFDQLGREAAVVATWTTTGGSIDDRGVLVASTEPGTYTVMASVGGSQLTATAVVSVVSTVSVDNEELPTAFALEPNYPNPFNPSTTISYSVPEPTRTRLVVYDMLGRQIALLVDEINAAGTYELQFVARQLPTGTYFFRMTAGDFQKTRPMVLVK